MFNYRTLNSIDIIIIISQSDNLVYFGTHNWNINVSIPNNG